MRTQTRVWIGVGIVAALAIGAGAAAVLGRPDGPRGTEAAAPLAPAASEWTPVCGFPGDLVSKLVADTPESSPEPAPLEPVVADVGLDDRQFRQLLVSDAGILLRYSTDDGDRFERFGLDGAAHGGFTVVFDGQHDEPPHDLGNAALSDDGRLFLIDSYGGRRDVVELGLDGSRHGRFTVPKTAETTGHPLDLTGVEYLPELDGGPALAVNEGERTAQLFRLDGTALGAAAGPVFAAGRYAASIDDGVVTFAARPGGEPVVQFRLEAGDDDAGDREPPYRIDGDVSILPAPDGDGALLYSATHGIESVDRIGVRRGIWLPEQFPEPPLPDSGLVAHGGDGYLLVQHEDGGVGLDRITPARLAAGLADPITLTAANEWPLAQLGLGIGPVTDRLDGHFDDGEAPSAAVRFDPGWGELGDAEPGADYELVVDVAGDPKLADPVRLDPQVLPVAVGGGDVPIALPDTRPGAYQVQVALRARGGGQPVSAACLHYSVGAPGAALDLGSLADGDDWGGPAPLRGVQLADRLGIGSFRVQLDFSGLVPDPESPPAADGIDWSRLPGGATDTSSDPFAELVAAADAARAAGVVFALQLGQGGGGESAAVDAGTWGGWAELIVAEIARRTGIHVWEPWNEPNMAYSGQDYTERIAEPFQEAAHRADPDAFVVDGNSLNLSVDWWADAAEAGICDGADALGVHPYTGWYRSWEEDGNTAPDDGYRALRDAIGEGCSALPIWDTESGWTSDGPASYWAQGAMTARKLVWNRLNDIEQWTYFFSEGGWGEAGMSWSLVQLGSYVKPAGLAFAATSRLLAGRPAPSEVDTGIPFAYAARFDGDEPLTAIWTDDLRTSAVVTTDASQLTVIDEYGARRTVPVDDGTAVLDLTGAPQFIDAGAAGVSIGPAEPFGDDLLAGRPVTASSTHDDLDARTVTSGTPDVDRAWRSGRLADGGVDPSPSLEIDLGGTQTIDRIAVASPAILCCESGLRDYTLSVRDAAGEWHVVAEQRGQFQDRIALFAFDPVEAAAVRLEVPWTTVRGTKVLSVNYGSFAGGLPTPLYGLATESDYLVAVSAISAWAPGG